MKNSKTFGWILLVGFVLAAILASGQSHEKKEGMNHIKLVKEKNGETIELDTFVEPGQVFVWEGDTIGKKLHWISEKGKFAGFNHGEGTFEYNVEVSDDGENQKTMIFKHGGIPPVPPVPGAKGAVWVTSDGDQVKVRTSGHPYVFATPGVNATKIRHGGNVIDLSDPGIISYKKKKISGGREKIEIIRNEADDMFSPMPVEMMGEIPGVPDAPRIISHDVKVFKGEGGEFHIIGDDGDMIKSSDGHGTYIIKRLKKEHGDLINIEEIEESDGKVIKVIVEEEKQENNTDKEKEKTETENKEGGN